ncbi:hypothetical protein CRG98_024917 [Punica granatum]|uniref:Uncharacterized protein n=1 Tax=Punica granatum TaxID=22663 RepID=A0A2I0JEQ5_PUNGR|nr:hypothetical protein CRG98_024917 [Punica granatum]
MVMNLEEPYTWVFGGVGKFGFHTAQIWFCFTVNLFGLRRLFDDSHALSTVFR